MGAFIEAAPVLASIGIPSIPTQPDDPYVPEIKRPDRIRVGTMSKLLARDRFKDANAALMCGRRAGVVVVDIDSPDPVLHDAAIETFGDTPVKIATPSHGLHLYYRHAGECRSIRLFGDDCPIDLLGSGLAVLPPSIRPESPDKRAGVYSLLEGSLTDLQHLPPMKRGAAPTRPATPQQGHNQHTGGTGRNVDLFKRLVKVANRVQGFDDLLIEARDKNSRFAPPLPDSEAATVARKVWQYRVDGKLWGGEARAAMSASELQDFGGNSDAICLMLHIRAAHGWRVGTAQRDFILANALGASLGWSIRRFRKARDWLADNGYLVCIHAGGNGAGDPPIFRFQEGEHFAHQYNIPPSPLEVMPSEASRRDASPATKQEDQQTKHSSKKKRIRRVGTTPPVGQQRVTPHKIGGDDQ